jgi:hypothetical protein
MQLGAILSGSPGEPCATEPVEFYLMRQTGQGRRRFRVSAQLLPVSEEDRGAARRDAIAYLRSLPEYQERDGVFPPIPQGVLDLEILYKFLCSALHDADNALTKLVASADYHAFRAGIIVEQVHWLNERYERFIKTQYPEIAPMKELEEQAAKK